MEDINDEVEKSIFFQQFYLKQHLEDLNKHCLIVEVPVEKESTAILDFIQNDIPELKEILTKKSSSKNENQEQVLETAAKTNTTKEDPDLILKSTKETIKIKKPERVTEEEVENFLLGSIFNVKIKKETNNG